MLIRSTTQDDIDELNEISNEISTTRSRWAKIWFRSYT